jgi:4-amino-4-deoxy-L-arabinose transferase-like glycosyltransferase
MFNELKTRNILKILFILGAVSLACRLAFTALATGFSTTPQSDSIDYLGYAHALVNGEGFVFKGLYAARPPAYPAFIAAVFWLFGDSIATLKVIQCGVGALITMLIYGLAVRMYDHRTAVVAGALSCIYYGLLEQPAQILSETLFTFLFAFSILLLLEKDVSYGKLLCSGMLLGLATLTRTITLVLPFFVIPWFWVGIPGIRALKISMVFLGGFILIIMPWTIRNYIVYHVPVPVNVQGGVDFWRSNSPLSNGQWTNATLETIERQNLSVTVRDKRYFNAGLAYLVSLRPGQLLHLWLSKIGSLLYPFLPGYDITYMLLLPFAGYGFIRVLRYLRKPRSVVVPLLLFYLFITSVYYGAPRFRGPLSPFLVVLAADGLRFLYVSHRHVFYQSVGVWAMLNLIILVWQEPLRLFLRNFRVS